MKILILGAGQVGASVAVALASENSDITVVDNVGDAYMSLNGGDGVLLSVYKSSTASTNEVSAACREAVAGLAEEFPTLDLRIVSDQGELIDTFISSILNSLLLGGLLAVVAESGAGKTTLMRDLEDRIVRENQPILLIKPYVLGMEDNEE